MKNKVFTVLLTLIIRGICLGQNTNPPADINALLYAGPGVWISSKAYKGVDSRVIPFPAGIAVMAPFYFKIDTAGCRLFSDSNMTFDIIATLRTDGFNEDDSDALEGMDDRNYTVDAGGEFAISGSWGKIHTAFLTDTLGQHDGHEFNIRYSIPLNFNESSKISPLGGIAFMSSNLANYYYGVKDSEELPDRPAYKPGASYKAFAGFEAGFKLNENWILFSNFRYYFLDSGIRRSPIVDKSYETSFVAGAMYKFK